MREGRNSDDTEKEVKPHDAGGDAFLYSTAFLNDISFAQNKLTAKIAQLKKLGTKM
jgi:hypothetical protein